MDIDIIKEILSEAYKRPSYIVTLLEFKLGRPPTQEEIDFVNSDMKLKRLAHSKWLEMQPWHIKKHHISKEERIRTVLAKRYNVPVFLLNDFTTEIENKYRDW